MMLSLKFAHVYGWMDHLARLMESESTFQTVVFGTGQYWIHMKNSSVHIRS